MGGARSAGGAVVQVDGRKGIVYERVDGPTMLHAVAKQPWTVPRAARQLAELHAQMHARTCEALPSQREKLRSAIPSVEQLSDDVRAYLLAQLEYLPDGDAVCHGDFHPDNIVMTGRGPVTIDWATASRGNPLADVARTSIMFQAGGRQSSADGPNRAVAVVLQSVRRVFYRIYLRRYCALRSVSREDVEAWVEGASDLLTALHAVDHV